ncbi:MAG: type II toxin-antitoxin system VapC family toxin [Candidatus Levybacteria bacterium]|nr:type II toxin-antitoxin system VapC family toxin [Candidatus Levybacteria bacterium]
MNYLVDTHIFLWSIISPKKIPQKIRKILNDPEPTKFVSVLSFWEISLKFSLDKIDLVGILPDELPDIAKKANFDIIDLDVKTASSYHKLPKTNNKDPFDRMLVWQAIQKNLYLLTKDRDFSDYKNHGLKIAL